MHSGTTCWLSTETYVLCSRLLITVRVIVAMEMSIFFRAYALHELASYVLRE